MAGEKYRYLPHTADIAFDAYGNSFSELLENSAQAMLGLMFELGMIRNDKAEAKTLRITEKASNSEDALWFTLQKIVSKVDEKGVSAFRFKVNRIAKGKEGFVVHGCIFYKRMKQYAALLDVKAVTPHELKVKKTEKGYSAHVLLDV